jgi:hypothetical protein
MENKQEGIGFRFPYDTAITARDDEENYLMIFRPKDSEDTSVSCRSELYIRSDKTYDEWKLQRQTNYKIHEENEKIINKKRIYIATAEGEFGAQYGVVILEGNNKIYSFGNPLGMNNECPNTHKEIADSIFVIP